MVFPPNKLHFSPKVECFGISRVVPKSIYPQQIGKGLNNDLKFNRHFSPVPPTPPPSKGHKVLAAIDCLSLGKVKGSEKDPSVYESRVPTHMSRQNSLTFPDFLRRIFPDLRIVVYIQMKQFEDNVSSSILATSTKNILDYAENKE